MRLRGVRMMQDRSQSQVDNQTELGPATTECTVVFLLAKHEIPTRIGSSKLYVKNRVWRHIIWLSYHYLKQAVHILFSLN